MWNNDVSVPLRLGCSPARLSSRKELISTNNPYNLNFFYFLSVYFLILYCSILRSWLNTLLRPEQYTYLISPKILHNILIKLHKTVGCFYFYSFYYRESLTSISAKTVHVFLNPLLYEIIIKLIKICNGQRMNHGTCWNIVLLL